MNSSSKLKRRLLMVGLLLLGLLTAILLIFSFSFRVVEMESTSMEPLIDGRGQPPTKSGDILIVARFVRHPVRKGDIVQVRFEVESNTVTTVRSVTGIPGDPLLKDGGADSDEANVPPSHYYLGAQSTNGIDSRQLGPIHFSNVVGKVWWILR